jgi:molybdopterin molybdotransferase
MTKQEDLSVNEALALILSRVRALPSERVPLLDALDRVLAEPIIARENLPPFANSSMDGYAVRAADVATADGENAVSLSVVADIAAGTGDTVAIAPGAAARIMTGAPLPDGADAVVPVEHTDEPWRNSNRTLPERIAIRRAVRAGDYVRYPGEDMRAGQRILESGHVLRPQEIGVLASLGVAEAPVVRRPRVGVLATGDELVPVESALAPGKIRNSNSYAQAAQVMALGGEPVMLGVARDSEADVRGRLDAAIDEQVDLLISSAGVSVGAYDVVKAVVDRGGEVAFWRVRMRPGKPLAFGTYRRIPFLGLPGNPVSAMVSFERFARPAILKMAGHRHLDRPSVRAILLEETRSDGRESYLRAVVTKDERGYVATTTGSQGSHVMTSLVKANALLIVPEGMTEIPAGTSLTALMIDWSGYIF